MKKIYISVLLLSVLSMSGCATAYVAGGAAVIGTGVAVATDDRGASTEYDDQRLADRAKDIAGDISSKGSYTVSAYEGTVLMAGQVPSQADKIKIIQSVQDMSGVRGVWDYLTVSHDQSVGQISEDSYLTSAAKTRLIAQKNVNTNNIKVVTCNGVVYLMGRKAGDPVEIDGAADGIREISGVRRVVNLIDKQP